MARPRISMLQLPVPQPSVCAATGNVPLAAGCLAVALRAHDMGAAYDLQVVAPELTDRLGDTLLAEAIARDEPAVLGVSLYLWNSERSLHVAREVKRRSPRTTVIVGGPEVSADNQYILGLDGYDIAVTGEAEDTFTEVLRRLSAGEEVRGVPGTAVRGATSDTGFACAPTVNFPLTRYPSPYRDGTLRVDPERATYLETVRGCRSHCTFCFYPKSSNTLRALGVAESRALFADVLERGARELVFLDPTFNHRPDFVPVLQALAEVNAAHGAQAFAEVRAEGLTAEHAHLLAKAGFNRLEIGLQSVNVDTLKRVKRYGHPAKVAEAARLLRDHGIAPMVDLILGLPGDNPDDMRAGIAYLREHDLGDDAQVFPLAVLPGTAMRATAQADGLVYDQAPPYRVRRSGEVDEAQLREILFAAEVTLERSLDEFPRPYLVDDRAREPRAVFVVACDGDDPAGQVHAAGLPGAQHVALWLKGRDLFGQRQLLAAALRRRLDVDPYATLDVVLAPSAPFEPDLVGYLRALLDAAPQSYLSRSQGLRGDDVQRRICVVLPRQGQFPAAWLDDLMAHARVFREQAAREALRDAQLLGAGLPAARVLDADGVDPELWQALAAAADPEAVVFADADLERRWVDEVLGYREVQRA